jgi:hypothetical protein
VVEGRLQQANVHCPYRPRHRAVFGEVLVKARAAGNHTSDGHPAALAIESGLEIRSAAQAIGRYVAVALGGPAELSPESDLDSRRGISAVA